MLFVFAVQFQTQAKVTFSRLYIILKKVLLSASYSIFVSSILHNIRKYPNIARSIKTIFTRRTLINSVENQAVLFP